jgi:pyridoxal/pyridoxine/pyridoxamine kinase
MRRAEAVTISAFITGKPRKAFRSALWICDPITGKTEIFRNEGG